MRTPTREEYSHEQLGDRFEAALSDYDTRRRVETLVDLFLTTNMIQDKSVLDVGCGLGFFSQRLKERGGLVTACDLGPTLVERTRQRVGCDGVVADVMRLAEKFGESSHDLVVSSECIEHTPDPMEALRQMAAVVKPGGFLAVSTPNVVWQPVVRAASALKLRPFDGHENFSTFGAIRKTLHEAGMNVVREEGLHLFPFQLGFHGLSTWCDRHLQVARRAMINICVLAQKPGPRDTSGLV